MVLVKPEDYLGPNPDSALLKYKDKTPKNVLTFCDGIMEEYSSDEEESPSLPTQDVVDSASLPWGPWMLYKTWAAGHSTLSFIDYLGEALASFFGITTPRFYFELEEYKRRKAGEEKEAEQAKGWSDQNIGVVEVQLSSVNEVTNQPKVDV